MKEKDIATGSKGNSICDDPKTKKTFPQRKRNMSGTWQVKERGGKKETA